MSLVRAALTQTANAFAGMPERVEDLPRIAGKLEGIRAANVEHNLALVAEAAAQGARIIGLGEMFTAPYFALSRHAFWRDMAEDCVDGPTVRALKAAASQHRIIIVAPMYEFDSETDTRFNTAVVIDETGTLLGKYRKTHIPNGANEQSSFCESFYFDRSNGIQNAGATANRSNNSYFPVFETSIGRVGIAICYDRHFEGAINALAANGAQLVFSPAVTFGAKSQRMWKMEFLVDAARHRVFIGGSNRQGAEKPWNQSFFGDSHFAGPDGERLENVSTRGALIIADVDIEGLSAVDPSGWDLARDRRPEIL